MSGFKKSLKNSPEMVKTPAGVGVIGAGKEAGTVVEWVELNHGRWSPHSIIFFQICAKYILYG